LAPVKAGVTGSMQKKTPHIFYFDILALKIKVLNIRASRAFAA